jgi:hypothetical protein
VEPHGQEPVAPSVRRNPPKLQSSFAKASEDTRIPPRSGDRGFLRRRVNNTPKADIISKHMKSSKVKKVIQKKILEDRLDKKVRMTI